jgi:hypothetical protein
MAKSKKTFTEAEVVKAYQEVYKRTTKALYRDFGMKNEERVIRENQTFLTLASLRHQLGIL